MEEGHHHVVVIEDDPPIAAGIVRGLKRAGFAVEVAGDGLTGIELASHSRTDLVILDLMLPELDGVAVLKKLRDRCAAPVIVVTARTEIETRVRVFDLGAIDYLPKPFFIEELIARTQARLGLSVPPKQQLRRFGAAVVDLSARAVEVAGAPVHLTPTEFAVLAYLVRRPGQAIARPQLAAALADLGEGSTRNLDAHVARLRRKLGESARHIVTVWGHGYCFEKELPGETS